MHNQSLSIRLFFALALLSSVVPEARPDSLTNWAKVSQTPFGQFTDVTFGGGAFVATSQIYNEGSYLPAGGISTSKDGVHWSHLSFYPDFLGVAYGNNTFVAVGGDRSNGNDSGFIYYSANGADWSWAQSYSEIPVGDLGSRGGPGVNGVKFGNGVFVAVSYFFEEGSALIFTSTNGRDWSQSFSIAQSELYSVAFGNGMFMAVGYGENPFHAKLGSILVSPNGTNWTKVATPSTSILYGVEFHDGAFFIANSGPTLYFSTGQQPISWQPVTLSPFPFGWIASLNGTSLAADTGAVFTSNDGMHWTSLDTGIPSPVDLVAAGNHTFVGLTQDGSIYTTATVLDAQVQAGNGGFLITIGGVAPASYRLQASTDLVNWTTLAGFTNAPSGNQYLDTTTPGHSRRFYRIISP